MRKIDFEKSQGVTLLALAITIIVLLILAGVSISMLTGDNGVITNANKAQSKAAYIMAKDQMEITNLSVESKIERGIASNSSYNATEGENFTKLVNIVKNDLGITSGSETADGKWKVEGDTTTHVITITYTDSKISKDLLGSKYNGKVIGIIKVEKQSSLYTFDTVPMPTDGLIMHCKLDSKTATDELGNTITYASDLPNSCFTEVAGINCFTTKDFTSSSAPLSMAYTAPNKGTISFWAYKPEKNDTCTYIYWGYHPYTSIFFEGKTVLSMVSRGISCGIGIKFGNWIHVCGTFDYNGIDAVQDVSLYIDGILSASISNNAGYNFTDVLSVGSEMHTSTFGGMNCYISSLRVYDRILTDEEIATLATEIKPQQYEEVNYLQSSGTQIIDTDILPSNSISAIMDFIPLEYSDYSLLGQRRYNDTNWRFSNNSNGSLFEIGGDVFGKIQSSKLTNGNRYTVRIGNAYLKIDDVYENIGTTKTYTFSSDNISIFGGYWSQYGIGYTKMKLYSLKMYDGENLIRNFVPVIRKSDNKPGLYDKVNNVFYANEGTGEFGYEKKDGTYVAPQ